MKNIIGFDKWVEKHKKVFMDGTWSHKYDTAKNEKFAEAFGESNDRTGYDAGNDPEPLTEHNQ